MQTRPRAHGSSASERAANVFSLNDNKAQRCVQTANTPSVLLTSLAQKNAQNQPNVFPHTGGTPPAPRDPRGRPSQAAVAAASLLPAARPYLGGLEMKAKEAALTARRTEPPSRVRHSPGGRRPKLRAGAGRGAAPRRARRPAVPSRPRRAGSDVPPPRKGGRCPARLCRRSYVAAVSGGRRGRHGARRGEVAVRPGGRRGCGCAPP